MTTSQTKDRACGVDDATAGGRDTYGRDTYGQGADTGARAAEGVEDAGAGIPGVQAVAESTEQAGAAVDASRHVQEATLAHQGQDGVLTVARTWTETLRRPVPFAPAPTRAVVNGGFDLFAQLLAGQRRFVDRLLAEQRRFVEQLLSPPEGP